MISHAEQFHELNQTRQHETRGQQLALFQPVASLNKTSEYWFFSDLHNLFGEKHFQQPKPKKKPHMKKLYTHTAKNQLFNNSLIFAPDITTASTISLNKTISIFKMP